MNNHKRGLWTERLAALWLQLKLYRIVARRYKTHSGEIDIVALRGNTLVFVEVKWRPTNAEAAYAIAPQAKRRIMRAAESFIQKHPRYAHFDMRFDAVLVSAYPFGRWIVHLKQVEMV